MNRRQIAAMVWLCAAGHAHAAQACREAEARGAVCEAANAATVEAMKARGVEAVAVMQDVGNGALLVFAASATRPIRAWTSPG